MSTTAVDTKTYYETIGRLEQLGASREYIQGWIGGFMGNPRREEQRTTEAYEAGYEDGENGTTDASEAWIER
ncbi:MAG: Alvin_2107 family globule sulfur oxidation protein [Gammaproteobacteria bacterium]